MKILTYIILIVLSLNSVKCQRRVHGGKVAEPGQFPYAVYFLNLESSCTGCIIHTEWVLSAAHCVMDSNFKIFRPYQINITAGAVDVDVKNKTTQIRRGKQIVLPHGDKVVLSVNSDDLSLIKVDQPFTFTEYVQRAEFMTSPWPQNKQHLFENCVAAGWGITEFGDTSKIKYINTTARHGRKTCPCINKFEELKKFVCLPNRADEGPCFGDSGGALLCGGKIVGVAHKVKDKRDCSYFKGTDPKRNCGNKNVYAIYMYTCPYMDWITEYVAGIPPKPESCKGIRICSPSNGITILLNIILWILFKHRYE